MAMFNMSTHLIHKNKKDIITEVYNSTSGFTSLYLKFTSKKNNNSVTISLNKETALNLITILELFASNVK